jgi:hypothetical protein
LEDVRNKAFSNKGPLVLENFKDLVWVLFMFCLSLAFCQSGIRLWESGEVLSRLLIQDAVVNAEE